MNKSKLIPAIVLGMSLALPACSLFESPGAGAGGSESGAPVATGNPEYDNMLKQVTDSYNALAKEGAAWTNAEEYFEQANEAAKAKQFDKAMKLLKEINDESALAKAQHEQQKSAGPHLF